MLKTLIAYAGLSPRLNLLRGPTPLEHHAAMSRDLGVEVFIKREDQADALGCGNKLRKLSYIVAEAEGHGATVLVTMGSLRSNQCKAVAAVAAQRKMRAHLVYGGDRQERPSQAHGSYLLTTFIEPTLTWCERGPWQSLSNELARVMEAERNQGECPWLIASGASDWPGLMGSIELGLEIADQVQAAGLSITDVVAPAGSGGTCLGIHLAAEQLQQAWRVRGFCIGEELNVVNKKIVALQNALPVTIGNASCPLGSLVYDDSARGAGYDTPRHQELAAMQHVVRHYGMLFDPNYMIKAFLGLRQAIAKGQIRRGSQVVLVHTGGQMGLFDGDTTFTAWHRDRYPQWLSEHQVPQ